MQTTARVNVNARTCPHKRIVCDVQTLVHGVRQFHDQRVVILKRMHDRVREIATEEIDYAFGEPVRVSAEVVVGDGMAAAGPHQDADDVCH